MSQVKTSLLAHEAAGTLLPALSESLALQLERSPHLQQELKQLRTAQEPRPSEDKQECTANVLEFPRSNHIASSAETAGSFLASSSRGAKTTRGWGFGLGLAAAASLVAAVLLVRSKPPHMGSFPREQAMQQPTASASATTLGETASILFVPVEILRGKSTGAVLPLPNPSRPVELQIQVHGTDATMALWTVSLLGVDQTVVASRQLQERSVGTVRYLSLKLPPGALTAGVYRLRLSSPYSAETTIKTFYVASH